MSIVRDAAEANSYPWPALAISSETPTDGWHPQVAEFFQYWLGIGEIGVLPGRQHFNPLDIPALLSRIWLLDVFYAPRLYRYRLVGTRETTSRGVELRGKYFHDVHAFSPEFERMLTRLDLSVDGKVATYRKGPSDLVRDKEHLIAEECMVPLARDGIHVDMVAVISVITTRFGGQEV